MGQFPNSGEAEMHSFMNIGDERAAPDATQEGDGMDSSSEEYIDEGLEEIDDQEVTFQQSAGHHLQGNGVRLARLPLVVGVTMLLMGLGMGYFAASESKAILMLAKLGLSPALLFISGTLAITLALSHRGNSHNSSSRLLAALEGELAAIRQDVAAILNDGLTSVSSIGGGGEHLGHFTIMFQKIENMIKNLTKATRMHSKPLMDLVGQVTDIQQQLGDVVQKHELTLTTNKNLLVALEKKLENLIERQLDKAAHLEKSFTQMESGIGQTIANEMDKLAKQNMEGGGAGGIDPLSIATIQQDIKKILDNVGSDGHVTSHYTAPAVASANASTAAAAPQAAGPTATTAGKDQGDGQPSSVMSAIERLREIRGS